MARTNDGKNDDGRKHGGEEVGERHEDGVAIAVIAHRVVGREGYQSSKRQAK